MSLQILLPNVDASAVNLGFIAPAPNGLQYFSFLGTEASLTENLANVATPQKVGSPTVNGLGLGAELGQENHINTGVIDAVNQTFIVSFKKLDASKILFGCYGVTTSDNPNLRQDGDNILYSRAGGAITTGFGTSDYNDDDILTVAVVVNNSTKKIDIYEMSKSKQNSVSYTQSIGSSGFNSKLGGSYGDGWQDLNPSTFYHCAIWDRCLNIAEIQTHYTVLKKYYAKFGVNV